MVFRRQQTPNPIQEYFEQGARDNRERTIFVDAVASSHLASLADNARHLTNLNATVILLATSLAGLDNLNVISLTRSTLIISIVLFLMSLSLSLITIFQTFASLEEWLKNPDRGGDWLHKATEYNFDKAPKRLYLLSTLVFLAGIFSLLLQFM